MNRPLKMELEYTTFDVAIIGGGIIGAGIARDAAMRGWKVALFEKGDFGGGTTSGSTRLIHGGLRYLEMLDFRLVRMDLRERETLLRIAHHLIKPLQFLMPFYSRSPVFRAKMRLGMRLYDLLSYDKSLPSRCYLTREQLLTLEPHLRREGLQGASGFFDAQVNSPERLCLENILSAREHGAATFNYCEVTGAKTDGSALQGLLVCDLLEGDELEVKTRIVVNAAGPWVDKVGARLSDNWQHRIRTTKGIHIACPPLCRHALALSSPIDSRLFFVIPWLGYTWVGTTDTDFGADPGEVNAEASDVRYLVESAAAYFPQIARAPIIFSNAGVRALVEEKGNESSISRMHKIMDGERAGARGLITVLGGKITGYRAIAEETTDMICRKLGNHRRCVTAATPLPGARPALPAQRRNGVAQETADHLAKLYGSRASQLLDLVSEDRSLVEPLAPDYPDIAAQVIFAVRFEQCVRASDFINRRTLLGFAPDQGSKAVPAVVELMGRELSWSPSRRRDEIEECARHRSRIHQHAEEAAELR